jgi:hypothetical protein
MRSLSFAIVGRIKEGVEVRVVERVVLVAQIATGPIQKLRQVRERHAPWVGGGESGARAGA